MYWKPAGTEAHVESRARDQALFLLRDHGDAAEAVLAAKLRRPGLTAPDRYRLELTAKAIKRLRKKGGLAARESTEIVVWRPRRAGGDWLLRLFGIANKDQRRNRS